jgi:hypothetical protein
MKMSYWLVVAECDECCGCRSTAALSLEIREGNRINPLRDGQPNLFGLTLNYDSPIRILPHTSVLFSGRVQHFWGLVNITGIEVVGIPRSKPWITANSAWVSDG